MLTQVLFDLLQKSPMLHRGSIGTEQNLRHPLEERCLFGTKSTSMDRSRPSWLRFSHFTTKGGQSSQNLTALAPMGIISR